MPEQTTHIVALNFGEKLKESRLELNLPDLSNDDLTTLNTFFKTSNEETALLSVALVCDSRDSVIEINSILDYLECSKIEYYKIIKLLESLEEKNLINIIRSSYKRRVERPRCFEITNKVYEALYYNSSEKLANERQKKNFFEEMEHFLEQLKDNNDMHKTKDACDQLLKLYPDNEIAKQILSYKLDGPETVVLFVIMIESLSTGTNTKVCLENTLSYYIHKTIQRSTLRRKINNESSLLNEKKLIEVGPQNYRDSLEIGLTDDTFNLLIPDEYKSKLKKSFKPNMCKLITPLTVNEKKLHYNECELNQVNELQSILNQSRLTQIQDRLVEKGLRKGVQILFYGPPGTGKTETVYQLAKSNNRHVLMVEINKIKSMWVGESEKNLKKIFDEYNNACKEYEQTPILLFNESDALINKRISVGSSVDSMQNAMQNILLQEMENFEGIFIATTNLITNLDEAFNRRFLYKLKLDKPTAGVRKKIINDLLPFLNDADKEQLAKEFEVSGGQLENIYRKSEMKFILNGSYPDLSELTAMFEQESMSGGSSRLIVRGYAA
jgi:hypothetical protein